MEKIEVKGSLPNRAHEVDAGADLTASESWEIPPGSRALVGTGTFLNLPKGFVGYVCPRSGLAAKHGVTVLNSPGVVDAGYTGEIFVNLINHGDEAFVIDAGDRIAQLVVQPVSLGSYEEVPEFTVRWGERGSAGHGSTGVT